MDTFRDYAANVTKWALAAAAAQMARTPDTVIALMCFMMIDYAAGLGVSLMKGDTSSNIGSHGLIKKLLTLLLLLSVHIAERLAAFELGLERIVALAFCANELISIIENCARGGVKIPKVLLSWLQKMKDTWINEGVDKVATPLSKDLDDDGKEKRKKK